MRRRFPKYTGKKGSFRRKSKRFPRGAGARTAEAAETATAPPRKRRWRRRVGIPEGRMWPQRKLQARQAMGLMPTPLVSDDGYSLEDEDWEYAESYAGRRGRR